MTDLSDHQANDLPWSPVQDILHRLEKRKKRDVVDVEIKRQMEPHKKEKRIITHEMSGHHCEFVDDLITFEELLTIPCPHHFLTQDHTAALHKTRTKSIDASDQEIPFEFEDNSNQGWWKRMFTKSSLQEPYQPIDD